MEDFLTEHINRSVGDVDLSLALKMGDLEAVKQRLQILAKEKGKWMIRNISDDRTMLHEACEFGHLNIVKFLIENGADINKKDSWSFTPLLCALHKKHLIIARYLIDKGAITTYRTVDGQKYSDWTNDRAMLRLLKDLENK